MGIKGFIMGNRKRVNLSIDADLDERWTQVANRLGWCKSHMVEDFLKEALPYLENLNPKSVIPKSLEAMGKKLQELGSLIDEADKKNGK